QGATMRRITGILILLTFAAVFSASVRAQTGSSPTAKAPSKIILDTDIGDDIDDAFALALALRSPEVEVIGTTTAWGDTTVRARLAKRLAEEAGFSSTPVMAGIATKSKTNFTQSEWAREGPETPVHPDAIEFLLRRARETPGEITLVAIGPLTNIGTAIDR